MNGRKPVTPLLYTKNYRQLNAKSGRNSLPNWLSNTKWPALETYIQVTSNIYRQRGLYLGIYMYIQIHIFVQLQIMKKEIMNLKEEK